MNEGGEGNEIHWSLIAQCSSTYVTDDRIYLGIVVKVEVRVGAVLLEEEELLLPFADLLLLLQEVPLHLDPLLPLRVGLLTTLAQRRVYLLGRGLLRLLRPGRQRSVIVARLLQGVRAFM